MRHGRVGAGLVLSLLALLLPAAAVTAAEPRAAVTIDVGTGARIVGTGPLVVVGAVSPGPAGRRAYVQVLTGTRWVTVVGVDVRNGGYQAPVRRAAAGDLRYRTVITTRDGVKLAYSASRVVSWYAWFSALDASRKRIQSATGVDVPVTAAGRVFPRSVVNELGAPSTSSIDVGLGGRCALVRYSTVFAQGTQNRAAISETQLLLDGAFQRVGFASAKDGSTELVVAVVHGADVLTWRTEMRYSEFEVGSGTAMPALATPEVLCRARP